ncbi:hypothetical protein CDEST_15457 [Colletotrichum destructivum]|uniref:Uncharacterized protein n=1 Tax=Colletotrichum destructivum TaxID=34406 RepID=A0AAX4J4Z3_9PEZI|nr:hypothetical protein CDEST_15457 [Colletotrichum destructivum]
MLRALGWIVVPSGRPNTRNTEVSLQSPSVLLDLARALKAAVRRPEEFIGLVFGSGNASWVKRCASIIKDSPSFGYVTLGPQSQCQVLRHQRQRHLLNQPAKALDSIHANIGDPAVHNQDAPNRRVVPGRPQPGQLPLFDAKPEEEVARLGVTTVVCQPRRRRSTLAPVRTCHPVSAKHIGGIKRVVTLQIKQRVHPRDGNRDKSSLTAGEAVADAVHPNPHHLAGPLLHHPLGEVGARAHPVDHGALAFQVVAQEVNGVSVHREIDVP